MNNPFTVLAEQPAASQVDSITTDETDEHPTENHGFISLAGDGVLKLSDPFPNSFPEQRIQHLTISHARYAYVTAGQKICTGSMAGLQAGVETVKSGQTQGVFRAEIEFEVEAAVSHIAFSSDGKFIYVSAMGGGLLVYDSASPQSGRKELHMGPLADLMPNPVDTSVALLTTTGDLIVQSENGFETITTGITAISWSKKGKQIIAGTGDGSLKQFTPAGVLKANLAPVNIEVGRVNAINWLENNLFIIAYESLDNEISLYLLRRDTNNGETTLRYTTIANPSVSFGDTSHTPQYHFISLSKDLILTASTTSADFGLVSLQHRASLSIDDDTQKAVLRFSSERDTEVSITGVAVQDDVSVSQKVIWYTDNDGGCAAWSLRDDESPFPNPCGFFPSTGNRTDFVATSGIASVGTGLTANSSPFAATSGTSSPFQNAGAFASERTSAASPFSFASASSAPVPMFGNQAVSLAAPAPKTAFGTTTSFGSSAFGQSAFGSSSSVPAFGGFGGFKQNSAIEIPKTGSGFGGMSEPKVGTSAPPAQFAQSNDDDSDEETKQEDKLARLDEKDPENVNQDFDVGRQSAFSINTHAATENSQSSSVKPSSPAHSAFSFEAQEARPPSTSASFMPAAEGSFGAFHFPQAKAGGFGFSSSNKAQAKSSEVSGSGQTAAASSRTVKPALSFGSSNIPRPQVTVSKSSFGFANSKVSMSPTSQTNADSSFGFGKSSFAFGQAPLESTKEMEKTVLGDVHTSKASSENEQSEESNRGKTAMSKASKSSAAVTVPNQSPAPIASVSSESEEIATVPLLSSPSSTIVVQEPEAPLPPSPILPVPTISDAPLPPDFELASYDEPVRSDAPLPPDFEPVSTLADARSDRSNPDKDEQNFIGGDEDQSPSTADSTTPSEIDAGENAEEPSSNKEADILAQDVQHNEDKEHYVASDDEIKTMPPFNFAQIPDPTKNSRSGLTEGLVPEAEELKTSSVSSAGKPSEAETFAEFSEEEDEDYASEDNSGDDSGSVLELSFDKREVVTGKDEENSGADFSDEYENENGSDQEVVTESSDTTSEPEGSENDFDDSRSSAFATKTPAFGMLRSSVASQSPFASPAASAFGVPSSSKVKTSKTTFDFIGASKSSPVYTPSTASEPFAFTTTVSKSGPFSFGGQPVSKSEETDLNLAKDVTDANKTSGSTVSSTTDGTLERPTFSFGSFPNRESATMPASDARTNKTDAPPTAFSFNPIAPVSKDRDDQNDATVEAPSDELARSSRSSKPTIPDGGIDAIAPVFGQASRREVSRPLVVTTDAEPQSSAPRSNESVSKTESPVEEPEVQPPRRIELPPFRLLSQAELQPTQEYGIAREMHVVSQTLTSELAIMSSNLHEISQYMESCKQLPQCLDRVEDLKLEIKDHKSQADTLIESQALDTATIGAMKSSMLSVEAQKVKIQRLLRAQTDPMFARSLKMSTLGPEHSAQQRELRRLLGEVESSLSSFQSSLSLIKGKLAAESNGTPVPTAANISLAVGKIMRVAGQKEAELDELQRKFVSLQMASPDSTFSADMSSRGHRQRRSHARFSIDGSVDLSLSQLSIGQRTSGNSGNTSVARIAGSRRDLKEMGERKRHMMAVYRESLSKTSALKTVPT